MPEARNRKLHKCACKRIAVTIINVMKPQTIGRTLGIGLRVAGRIAGQHLAGEATAPNTARAVATSPAAAPGQVAAVGQAVAVGQSTVRAASQAGRGVSGFFRPFRRVGGVVLLEVVGVFFLLPVIVFAPKLWEARASWMHGPDHRTFVASAIFVVVFLYLGVTSFLRARRRSTAR
jgi:hypothetical protein